MSPDFLLTSCTIRLPIDPACSRSLAGPFFLVSIFQLSGCFPVALSVSAPIALLLSCALGDPWSALRGPGRLVRSLSLSLYATRCAPLAQISCSPSVSRHIARWRVACAGVAVRTLSKSSAANQPRVVVCRALRSRLFRLHSCLQVALCVLNASAATLPRVRPLTGRSKDAHGEERHRGRLGCQSGNQETLQEGVRKAIAKVLFEGMLGNLKERKA